jgi:LMBR1 domain-containing protein 1
MTVEYDGFPLYTFINKSLNALEGFGTTFVATGVLSVMMLYLLCATVAGNFQAGITIPFLFTMHPMVPNETWMNSFLFNIAIILFASVSITHFSALAFS